MTNWTPGTITSTSYSRMPTTIVYDETDKTYDTLATYYDGNTLYPPFQTNYTKESINNTNWS